MGYGEKGGEGREGKARESVWSEVEVDEQSFDVATRKYNLYACHVSSDRVIQTPTKFTDPISKNVTSPSIACHCYVSLL